MANKSKPTYLLRKRRCVTLSDMEVRLIRHLTQISGLTEGIRVLTKLVIDSKGTTKKDA